MLNSPPPYNDPHAELRGNVQVDGEFVTLLSKSGTFLTAGLRGTDHLSEIQVHPLAVQVAVNGAVVASKYYTRGTAGQTQESYKGSFALARYTIRHQRDGFVVYENGGPLNEGEWCDEVHVVAQTLHARWLTPEAAQPAPQITFTLAEVQPMLDALESCYNVLDYPADGGTEQDRAIANFKRLLEQKQKATGQLS